MSNSDSFAFAALSVAIHLCASIFITGYYGPSGPTRETFTEVSVLKTPGAEPVAETPPAQDTPADAVPEPASDDEIPVAEEAPAESAPAEPQAAQEPPAAETPEQAEEAPAQEAVQQPGSDSDQPFGIALPGVCPHPHSAHNEPALYRTPYMDSLGPSGVDMLDGVGLRTLGDGAGPNVAWYAPLEYPWLASMYNLEGQVVLRLYLDSFGKVHEILVVESAGSVLDDAAVEAAANSVYRPAVENGRPMACYVFLPVRFEL